MNASSLSFSSISSISHPSPLSVAAFPPNSSLRPWIRKPQGRLPSLVSHFASRCAAGRRIPAITCPVSIAHYCAGPLLRPRPPLLYRAGPLAILFFDSMRS